MFKSRGVLIPNATGRFRKGNQGGHQKRVCNSFLAVQLHPVQALLFDNRGATAVGPKNVSRPPAPAFPPPPPPPPPPLAPPSISLLLLQPSPAIVALILQHCCCCCNNIVTHERQCQWIEEFAFFLNNRWIEQAWKGKQMVESKACCKKYISSTGTEETSREDKQGCFYTFTSV